MVISLTLLYNTYLVISLTLVYNTYLVISLTLLYNTYLVISLTLLNNTYLVISLTLLYNTYLVISLTLLYNTYLIISLTLLYNTWLYHWHCYITLISYSGFSGWCNYLFRVNLMLSGGLQNCVICILYWVAVTLVLYSLPQCTEFFRHPWIVIKRFVTSTCTN